MAIHIYSGEHNIGGGGILNVGYSNLEEARILNEVIYELAVTKETGWRYGWKDGKLEMEQPPLPVDEEELLKELTDIAFKEIAERTRTGSGDDQAYVNSMYDHLNQDGEARALVRVTFLLCKQAIRGKSEARRWQRK
jgi:hypothetical protein